MRCPPSMGQAAGGSSVRPTNSKPAPAIARSSSATGRPGWFMRPSFIGAGFAPRHGDISEEWSTRTPTSSRSATGLAWMVVVDGRLPVRAWRDGVLIDVPNGGGRRAQERSTRVDVGQDRARSRRLGLRAARRPGQVPPEADRRARRRPPARRDGITRTGHREARGASRRSTPIDRGVRGRALPLRAAPLLFRTHGSLRRREGSFKSL